MADLLNQPVDPKILSSLMGALLQSKVQQMDPAYQARLQAQQFELEQAQAKRALVEAARARLGGTPMPSGGPQPAAGGGLPGEGPGGPNAPFTYGVNPRTGIASFNNLGWMGDTSALPENQQRVAQRLNNEAIVGRQQRQPTPVKPEAMRSIAQVAMDLNLAGVPGGVQDLILDQMFPGKLGTMTDREKSEAQDRRSRESAAATAQNQELAAQRSFVRDMLKTQAQGVDPKRYQLAQDAVAAAISAGQDPNAIAQSFGFNFMQDRAGPLRGMMSFLPGVNETTGSNIVLEPTGSPLQQILRNAQGMPEAVQQLLGTMPRATGTSVPSTAPAPQQQERVVVTKGGKDFSLPASQLKDAEKQGYKLKK